MVLKYRRHRWGSICSENIYAPVYAHCGEWAGQCNRKNICENAAKSNAINIPVKALEYCDNGNPGRMENCENR